MSERKYPKSLSLDGRGYRTDTVNGGAFVPLLGPNNSWRGDLREPKETADRIVSCYNALADVPNPEGVPKAIDKLKEITKGKGRYSIDPLTHAGNAIEDMKDLAIEALKVCGIEVE